MKISKFTCVSFCTLLMFILLTAPADASFYTFVTEGVCGGCGGKLLYSDISSFICGSYSTSCSTCGIGICEGVSVHEWTELSRMEATCVDVGSAVYTCSSCNLITRTDDLPVLGHDWTETRRTPATCITAGTIYYSCSRCDETKVESIPQLAEDHTWTETTRLPATCTAAGKVDYICSVCSAEKSEPLAALDHAWDEASRTPATCLVPGMIRYSCSRCDETKTETIPQLGTKPYLDCLRPDGRHLRCSRPDRLYLLPLRSCETGDRPGPGPRLAGNRP